jgi:hypothetical protein
MSKEELRDFWDRCNRFDWYYDFSDDAYVWRKANEERKALKLLAATNLELQIILDGFAKHYSVSEKVKTAKPVRP